MDDIHLTRYTRAPNAEPQWTFGDALGLAEFATYQDERGLHVALEWVALDAPEIDYTVSVFLLRDGQIASQHDSFPLNGHSPTSTWQAGGVYSDRHLLQDIPAGDYDLGVKVYDWQSGEVLPCGVDCEFVTLSEIRTDGSRD